MTCSRIKRFSESNKQFVDDYGCYERSQNADVADVIEQGGLFVPTCSIIYRSVIMDHYPDYCKSCHVGDYPLQIMAAMKGKIYYFNDVMAVYRVDNQSSWVGRLAKEGGRDFWHGIKSEIRMLQGFCADYPQYKEFFENRIKNYIGCTIPDRRQNVELYRFFKKEIRQLSLKSRVGLYYDRSWLKRMFMVLKRKM